MGSQALKPVPPPEGAELLRVEHVAFLLDVSTATVYREINDGKLATRRIRDVTRIHREDLASYLRDARRQYQSEAEATPAASTGRISLRAAGLIDDDDFAPKRRRRVT